MYMTHIKQYAQGHAARILEGPLQSKTTVTSGTKLEGKHTTVVIGRHVAIRIYEPKVVAHLPSPCTNKWSVYFINNRYKLWFHSYMYQYSARSFIRKSIGSIIRKIWHIHWELGKVSVCTTNDIQITFSKPMWCSLKLILRVSFQQCPFFEVSRDYRWCSLPERLAHIHCIHTCSSCVHTCLIMDM